MIHVHSGKVRDIYEFPYLFMLASDRISTHNVKHTSIIEGKGELLTALTVFWALKVFPEVPNHLVAWGQKVYDYIPPRQYDSRLKYQGLVVMKRKVIPREFVWRSFLTGSLWDYYKVGMDPYGLNLPQGLPKMYFFEKPIFTPTEKSEMDEPRKAEEVGFEYLEASWLTGQVYEKMSEYLKRRNITLVDAKFECAEKEGLVDEWGTGDCCRMAWTRDIKVGEDPPWLDKEVFRQAAVGLWGGGPRVPLEFPPEVIERGLARYHEAFVGITGMTLKEFQEKYMD